MEKPVIHLERLFEDIGTEPTSEQINQYNKMILDSIHSRYIAFTFAFDHDVIVAHGNERSSVKNHSIARKVFNPIILENWSARKYGLFHKPLGIYPDAKA